MKKKLALLSMMLCSIFGFFACGEDPYASLSLDSSVKEVVMTMEAVNNGGEKEYKLEPYSFDVQVSGETGDMSSEVEVFGGLTKRTYLPSSSLLS